MSSRTVKVTIHFNSFLMFKLCTGDIYIFLALKIYVFSLRPSFFPSFLSFLPSSLSFFLSLKSLSFFPLFPSFLFYLFLSAHFLSSSLSYFLTPFLPSFPFISLFRNLAIVQAISAFLVYTHTHIYIHVHIHIILLLKWTYRHL